MLIMLYFLLNVLGTGFADICVGLCDPTVFYNDLNNTIGTVMCTFDVVVENGQITWPRLQWLFEYMWDFNLYYSTIHISAMLSMWKVKLIFY